MTIRLSHLIPGAVNCMHNVAKIRPGEEVLILADTTSNPDVTEAYRIAAELEGANVSVLTLASTTAGASSDEITHNALYSLWPKVAFSALAGADWCVNLTAFTDIHGLFGTGASTYGMESMLDIWEKYQTRMLSVVITNKEGLASDWATYPEGLLRYLGRKAHEHLLQAAGAKLSKAHLHVTDPQGTNLSLEGFTMVTKSGQGSSMPFYTFGTEMVGLKPMPTAEGFIVSTSIHSGWIPEMKLTIKGGRAVHIEGGGQAGVRWVRDFEKCKHADSQERATAIFGSHPGPGVNWIEELMYGVHPKAFRLGHKYRWQGSDAFGAWNGGTRRSGTLHFGIGGGKDEWYRHRDLELFFPTLIVNGETIIDRGRLVILDDEEVRVEASKYGDSDDLLTEKWIPDMPPND
jgi:hypothetical protein